MWTQDKLFIRSALEVILTLCFVGNHEKITTKKLHVCIVIRLNIILPDWTISEHWRNSERKPQGEHFVNAQWALCKRLARMEQSRDRKWTHGESTVSAWKMGKQNVSGTVLSWANLIIIFPPNIFSDFPSILKKIAWNTNYFEWGLLISLSKKIDTCIYMYAQVALKGCSSLTIDKIVYASYLLQIK